jgi:hypothetical protein
MSLPVWQATIVNEFGEIIPSPTMTIINEATGLGLTVYSDVNGTTALGTNGVFTGGTDGFAQFFAPAGRYSIKAENLGLGFERTFRFVAMVGDSAFYGALGTASLVDTGTAAGEVPLNSNLGTASLVSTGLLTGNVPTADQLSMVGETVNYTGANFQPTTPYGLNTRVYLFNNSGSNITNGSLVSAGVLEIGEFNSGGAFVNKFASPASGNYINVNGSTLSAGEGGLFAKES